LTTITLALGETSPVKFGKVTSKI